MKSTNTVTFNNGKQHSRDEAFKAVKIVRAIANEDKCAVNGGWIVAKLNDLVAGYTATVSKPAVLEAFQKHGVLLSRLDIYKPITAKDLTMSDAVRDAVLSCAYWDEMGVKPNLVEPLDERIPLTHNGIMGIMPPRFIVAPKFGVLSAPVVAF